MPSAANFSRREAERLGSLTFFLDYQIGRYTVAQALRAAGAKVEVHIDHFNQAAPDVEWIPVVARNGWVLITKDEHIRRNPVERAAYEEANLRGFVVTGKDMSGSDLASLLVPPCPAWCDELRAGPDRCFSRSRAAEPLPSLFDQLAMALNCLPKARPSVFLTEFEYETSWKVTRDCMSGDK